MTDRSDLFIVVDDDKMMREYVKIVLGLLIDNGKIETFLNADTALEFIKNIDIKQEKTLIISDVDMPGMSGIEFLKIIKEEFPKIFFVIMSGNPDNQKTAATNNCDIFLKKPFLKKNLEQIFQVFINK